MERAECSSGTSILIISTTLVWMFIVFTYLSSMILMRSFAVLSHVFAVGPLVKINESGAPVVIIDALAEFPRSEAAAAARDPRTNVLLSRTGSFDGA